VIPHEAAAVLDEVVDSCTALAIGPGLGTGIGAQALALRAVQQQDVTVVVDADAINALADVPELSRDFHAAAVLTPHPGEFRRLAGALRIGHDPAEESQRAAGAEALAQRLGCVVVLKGAGTVVSDGHRTWTCERGHACLATAGTGDVLTGVIAGLAAQFVRPVDPVLAKLPEPARRALGADAAPGLDLFEAARAGVLAHALAGERWAAAHGASAGLLAPELAEFIPVCVESLRTG
jgi:NAD(P)H-hydrate epimerase